MWGRLEEFWGIARVSRRSRAFDRRHEAKVRRFDGISDSSDIRAKKLQRNRAADPRPAPARRAFRWVIDWVNLSRTLFDRRHPRGGVARRVRVRRRLRTGPKYGNRAILTWPRATSSVFSTVADAATRTAAGRATMGLAPTTRAPRIATFARTEERGAMAAALITGIAMVAIIR